MIGRCRDEESDRGGTASGRGQSEVLSVALLLAITVAGSGLVVAFGSSALSDSQQASEIDSAEHAMTQFDSKASLVGLGASSAQTVSLGTDGTTRVYEDRGWLRVRVVNGTDGSTERHVMTATLGAVVYENGGTEIAYQGGGVWKRADGGSTMVSPPEFHYRGTTLTLPLVTVNANDDEQLGDRVRMTRDGPTNSTFPRSGDPELQNPLEDGQVNVTVSSDYYDAWGRFFEERTGGNVTYDHARDRVTITLVVPGDTKNVTNALAGTTPGGMTIKGSGGSSFTDSYNSSEGAYDEDDPNSDGTIVTAGSVTLQNGDIYGDLQASGTVELKGNGAIHGNLSHGGPSPCNGNGNGNGNGNDNQGGGQPNRIGVPLGAGSFASVDSPPSAGVRSLAGPGCDSVEGWIANNGTAPELNPIGDAVRGKVETYSDSANNNNTKATAIDGNVWSDGERLTLHSDPNSSSVAYYVSEDVPDSLQTLEFDTSEGDIVLAIDDDVVWNDVDVEATHPEKGQVRIYTTASTFRVEGGSIGDTENHRSPSFRVYGQPGLDVTLDGHATFVGLVYAPGSESTTGSITVRTHAELFGGIVGGGDTLLQSGGSIHFDEALRSVNPQDDVGKNLPQLTYLHVSESRVNVTNA